MIKIDDKHNCCGCAACVQICPKQCISFEEDKKGFCYPIVNTELCVDCKLCERVCPVINPHSSHKPTKVYAAKISNEAIRLQSSSGGIFTALAETIINDGGVVFGVGFDSNWEVEHKYTDTLDGLSAFRGSKYVQSRVGKTYKQVQEFLHQGRKVLFSGTPCQIAGLHKFLGMRYDNLMTVDVVCHGVPSPLVWRAYLDYVLADGRRYISAICFRDKATGWKKFSFSIKSSLSEVPLIMEKHSSNCYMQFYLNNLSLRPSCYKCPANSGKSASDLTIADYWGVSGILDDDMGISLIMQNSVKGADILNSLPLSLTEVSYNDAVKSNFCIENSVQENEYVPLFWEKFHSCGIAGSREMLSVFRQSLLIRIVKYILRIVR